MSISMNQISILIFDIGGVLIFQSKPNWNVADRKFHLPEGTIHHIVADCFRRRTIDRYFNERLYFEETHSKFISWDTYQTLLKDFFFGETLNEPLVHWIREKKSSGITIYALTNNTVTLTTILRRNHIEHLFDRVFNSADVGLVKPNPLFFEWLLRETKAELQSCLFVDDNLQNIEAAKKLGIPSLQFIDNPTFFSNITVFKL